jgi:hypothetical protein
MKKLEKVLKQVKVQMYMNVMKLLPYIEWFKKIILVAHIKFSKVRCIFSNDFVDT